MREVSNIWLYLVLKIWGHTNEPGWGEVITV